MAHQPTIFATPARGVSAALAFAVSLSLICSTASSAEQHVAESAGPIAELSDVQLTDLAADWEQLDAQARSDLIAETRERMLPGQATVPQAARPIVGTNPTPAPNSDGSPLAITSPALKGAGTAPQVSLRAERRRYGRVVRQADGSLVRIETQVVRVQRRDPQRAFGVGFERRHNQHDARQQPIATERVQPADSPRQDILVVSDTLD